MGVKVFIIGLDDERLEIDLCDTEEQLKDITVLDLKRRIKDRKGISELEQVIVFAGKRLKDDRPLSDYGVKDLSTLHMVRQQEPGAGGSVGSDEDGGMGDKKGKNKRVIRSELGRSYKHTKTTEMGVKVFIFGLRGEKFTIDLCDTEEQLKDITVLDLKRRIKEREGIPDYRAADLVLTRSWELVDLMEMVEWVTRMGKTKVRKNSYGSKQTLDVSTF
ncbi:polyubiquitin isoform X3 [Larimichthys crocea]|uniref:polyubiquitin isoform X3 n=1 Tax=Larimichthys crocea TaxID=215358 RepID=UPI000F5E71C1|nr:polyubiquitin isoform X3 [Larimichthys crocea]